MNYHNTYSDLSNLINAIYGFLDNYIEPEEIEEFKLINQSSDQIIRFMIGAIYFDISFTEALKLFRSNRYFIDSIGIKILPSLEKIKEVEKYLICNKPIIKFLEKIIEKVSPNYRSNSFDVTQNISEENLKFLDEHGYLIIENAIPLNLCDHLAGLILEISEIEKNSAKGGYIYGAGNMQRIYNLIAKDEIFQELIIHPTCHHVMRHMFKRDNFHDKYYLTSFHANLLYKDAEPQIWHIDANVPDPIPPWIIRSNSNFIIHDYSEENGATEIIPGSHKFLRKPQMDEIDANYLSTKFIEAPKGSIAFWHGHLWHRSGRNVTDKPRIALLGAYSASFLREVSMEENPYLSIHPSKYNELSPDIKKLLGWNHGVKDYS